MRLDKSVHVWNEVNDWLVRLGMRLDWSTMPVYDKATTLCLPSCTSNALSGDRFAKVLHIPKHQLHITSLTKETGKSVYNSSGANASSHGNRLLLCPTTIGEAMLIWRVASFLGYFIMAWERG